MESDSGALSESSDLVKIENHNYKWSHKLERIKVGRIRIFPSDHMKTRLSELEAEGEQPTLINCIVQNRAL